MGIDKDKSKNTAAIWAFWGVVIAALITGIVTLIVADKIPFILATQTLPPPVVITESVDTFTTDSLAGNWSGTVNALDGSYSVEVNLTFQPNCSMNEICGTFVTYQNSCAGTLTLVAIDGDTFIFLENKTSGDNSCGNCYEHIQKLSGNSISFSCSQTGISKIFQSTGLLSKP